MPVLFKSCEGCHEDTPGVFGALVARPLSREFGTGKAVRTRIWSWLSGQLPFTLDVVPFSLDSGSRGVKETKQTSVTNTRTCHRNTIESMCRSDEFQRIGVCRSAEYVQPPSVRWSGTGTGREIEPERGGESFRNRLGFLEILSKLLASQDGMEQPSYF